MIQSQFWAASTRTFSETFPQNGHRTDDQRSVSTILKECLGQLLGPNRRKPTERDEIGPVRHHRRESASPALPHLRIRIRFIFVSRKIGEISRLFEGLKASDQTAQLSLPSQRNGLPPPQHNLVEVRLSPPPPMATRRRTMDGRLAEDAMILIDTRRQSRVALAVAAGSPDSFVGSDLGSEREAKDASGDMRGESLGKILLEVSMNGMHERLWSYCTVSFDAASRLALDGQTGAQGPHSFQSIARHHWPVEGALFDFIELSITHISSPTPLLPFSPTSISAHSHFPALHIKIEK